ncbi:MAG TPA: hypothetical protein PLW93_02035 [Candidatus Absconditabacterales bacterium]|nr:hypothetical protein [Candidatus Absconditabacterales bacterium]
METIYQRQQRKLIKRGISTTDAQRIAYFQQRDKGTLNGGKYDMSDYGKRYSGLTSIERQLLRRAKREGRMPGDYIIYGNKVKLRNGM